MKLHPDIIPAVSIMVAGFLFIQPAMPFVADFHPQNWEPFRRLVEVLAKKLFHDKSFRAKQRKYLDQIQWNKALGSKRIKFVQIKSCSKRRGVSNEKGEPVLTPQSLFVDDFFYAKVYEHDMERIE